MNNPVMTHGFCKEPAGFFFKGPVAKTFFLGWDLRQRSGLWWALVLGSWANTMEISKSHERSPLEPTADRVRGCQVPLAQGTNGPGTRRCTVIKGVASRITYKWPKINGDLGVINQLIGVITPITTSRGPPCRGLKNTLLKGHIRELFSLKLRMKGGFRYCENICFVGRGIVS